LIEWKKLSKEDTRRLRLSTYDDEVILINGDSSELLNKFFFNAQEFFSDEEIESFPWYNPSPALRIKEKLNSLDTSEEYVTISKKEFQDILNILAEID
jgi:hypothetical protein